MKIFTALMKCFPAAAVLKENVSLASNRQPEEKNQCIIDQRPGQQHNDCLISHITSLISEPDLKISIPFSGRAISLILLMLLGEILASRGATSSIHRPAAAKDTDVLHTAVCLQSLGFLSCKCVGRRRRTGDLLWRLRGRLLNH